MRYRNPITTLVSNADVFRRDLAAHTDALVARQRRSYSSARAKLIQEQQALYDATLALQLRLEEGRGS
jgi:hypothetical protein